MHKIIYLFSLLFFIVTMKIAGNPFSMPFAGKKETEGHGSKKTPRKNPLIDKSLDELLDGKQKAMAKKDFPTVIKYLDALRIVCTKTDQAKDVNLDSLRRDCTLELADLYYDQQEWAKAEKVYLEFILLYPGDASTDLASYKSIDCGFKLTNTIDRDQTKTQEILDRAKKFLSTYTQSAYNDKVQQLHIACKQKLFDHEDYIFQFYVKSKKYKAAHMRLERMNIDLKPSWPEFEPHLLELTVQLASAENNMQKMLHTQLELHQKFPTHEITQRLIADIEPIKIQLAALEKAQDLELPAQKPIMLAKR